MARLLMDIGIYMGRRLLKNAESLYFKRLNRGIFVDAGARWNTVDSILRVMHSQKFVERQIDATRCNLLQNRCFLKRDVGIMSYFGSDLWEEMCRNSSIVWGWKDPRTTITFPIWIRLFPRARFVHIIRNGIDVAISINRRARKRQNEWSRKLFPRDYSPVNIEFDYCFHLWEKYVSFALEHKHLIPSNQYLEVRYEDLLMRPQEQLRWLVDFLNYSVKDSIVFAACERVDQSRLDNSIYAARYRDEIPTLVSSPIMRQLGYSYSVGYSVGSWASGVWL